jgi:hypothetical protein
MKLFHWHCEVEDSGDHMAAGIGDIAKGKSLDVGITSRVGIAQIEVPIAVPISCDRLIPEYPVTEGKARIALLVAARR